MLMEVYISCNYIKFNIINTQRDIKKYIYTNEIVIPISFSISEKLRFIRNFLNTIISSYSISLGIINKDDKEINNDIIKIEAIIEELFCSCGVRLYGN